MGHATMSTYQQIISKISKQGKKRVKSYKTADATLQSRKGHKINRYTIKEKRNKKNRFKQMKSRTPRLGPSRDKPIARKQHSKNVWTA